MSTAPTANKALPVASPQDKFSLEKSDLGGITVLKLHGTLDHAFEGKRVADAVKGAKIVIDMRDVRRFASWGMSEWMNFLRVHADHDLYLVECSTYSMSQMNLVTGLLGHGKLVSFYAPYRCASCGEESETLFIIPVDRDQIRDLATSYQDCATCGGRARLEDYPAAFFETIADRAPFDIDDEVLAYMRGSLKYPLTPDLKRFRAHRRVSKDYTYLRLSGSLTTMPSDTVARAVQGTTVLDLANVVYDPTHLTAWRTFVQAAMPKTRSLQLLNAPIGFVEHGVKTEDLRDRLKVRTLALSYDCVRCGTTTPHMVDVAENLEQLVQGLAPIVNCATCKSQLQVAMPPGEAMLLRSLPARDNDPVLDRFLAKARGEPSEKLEDALAVRPAEKPKAPGGGRGLYLVVGLTMLVIVGLGVVAFFLWKERGEPTQVAAGSQTQVVTPPVPVKPGIERPDWIMSDVPSSAYCHDMINRLMCVGVSPYMPTRDGAVAEANDAALEELVTSVGLKVSDPFFRDNVMAGYSEVRTKALSALQSADLDRATAAYTAAEAVVSKARKHVTELLQASGGAAVPAQRSDWYWEEYAAKGGGSEFLVFVRYDVTLDAVKSLVEKYSAPTPVLGSTAVTAFPGLAWKSPEFPGGAMLTKVGNPLAGAGVAAQDVVLAAQGQTVSDAATLAKHVDDWKKGTGPLKLTVKTGDAAPRDVELKKH